MDPRRGRAFSRFNADEEEAFLAKLRAAAAAGWHHTTIACAPDSDVLELREIVRADHDAIEDHPHRWERVRRRCSV